MTSAIVKNGRPCPHGFPTGALGTLKTPIGLRITGYKRFNASGDLKRDIAFLDYHRVRRVKAARIDRIIQVGETKESVSNGGKFHQWLNCLLKLCNSKELKHYTKQNRKDAFWRTLITDTSTSRRCPVPCRMHAARGIPAMDNRESYQN